MAHSGLSLRYQHASDLSGIRLLAPGLAGRCCSAAPLCHGRAHRIMILYAGLPFGLVYSTIVVDPPWRYGDSLPGRGRGAAKHYETLSVEEIARLPIPDLAAENAHLWIWVTNSFVHEGFHLMAQWGFAYKTLLTWVKPQIGMGRYLRNTTEHALLGVRGRLQAEGPKNIPSHIVAPRSRHSRKPDEAYVVFRTISPAPRIDLFAQKGHEGFDVWGNAL